MNPPTLVFCLEEPSAKVMLESILPRLLPSDFQLQFMVFEGKPDLLNRLEMRIRAWCRPNSRFLVLCDQDGDDCLRLKARLLAILRKTGKGRDCKARIACHELENFFLGDLGAIEEGLGRPGLSKLSAKRRYRDPDALANAPDQLGKILGERYRKCEGARSIAPHLDLTGVNSSTSFNMLVSAIRELAGMSKPAAC